MSDDQLYEPSQPVWVRYPPSSARWHPAIVRDDLRDRRGVVVDIHDGEVGVMVGRDAIRLTDDAGEPPW